MTQYGMSEKFGLIGLETRESMYLNNGTVLNCSDQTATDVDSEVMRILRESYDEAKRLLLENRTCLDKIAEFLIEKESITGKEFMEIFRKVKEGQEEYHQEELIFAEYEENGACKRPRFLNGSAARQVCRFGKRRKKWRLI